MQKAGFILEFREHHSAMSGKKKGNVDVDIVFQIMRRLIEEDDFDKIVLVTGDGDYIKLVKYLIEKARLKKILFPNKMFSSLYRKIQKDTAGILIKFKLEGC
ncbi:NYN domain-containing protein [Candidatus Gracilibacteria bacterium]|nr:NYN domain-containing protein [Candidatus Gracilibacteria bacterium]